MHAFFIQRVVNTFTEFVTGPGKNSEVYICARAIVNQEISSCKTVVL